MMASAIRHLSFYPFVQPLARNRIRFRLDAADGDLETCSVVWWKRTDTEACTSVRMTCTGADGQYAQWSGEVMLPAEIHYIKYIFCITGHCGETAYYGPNGLMPERDKCGCFERLQVNETDVLQVPEWSRGCIYYQIFPERFSRRGDRAQFDDWHAMPTRENYLGGNLAGILDRLPYLSELGIECIYLNPVFLGDFNHKYATTDYFRVDPLFGTEADLAALVDVAHGRHIRVILDGVFNHTGIHFMPFQDLMEKGAGSRYRNWFYPKAYPVRVDPACYECVGDYPYMPRLNGANPEVREYIEKVLLYWLEKVHIDGWRFDVADELDRHAVTGWREAVKQRFPEALLLAETWGDASGLLGPDGFDSAMNYLFRDAAADFFACGTLSAMEMAVRLNRLLMRYPPEITLGMYNLLGSHDTARFLTEAGGVQWKLRLAMAFQMCFPGAPAIYYGDEVGMTGGNDPLCRAGMNWDSPDTELYEWQRQWIETRKAHPALRRGDCRVSAEDRETLVLRRMSAEDRLLVIFNIGAVPKKLDFAETAGSVDVRPHSVEIISF